MIKCPANAIFIHTGRTERILFTTGAEQKILESAVGLQ